MARPGEKCAPGSSRWFFRFRFRWQRSIERLTDAEAGRLVKALLYYAITGEAVDLPGKESVLMTMLLDDLDEDVTDAAYTSSTNRQNAMTRWHGTAVSTGCDRMRSDATAYKDGKEKDLNTPCSPPMGDERSGGPIVRANGRSYSEQETVYGRSRAKRRRSEVGRSGSSAYSEEDLRRIEANEVDLNSGDPAKEESDERMEEI